MTAASAPCDATGNNITTTTANLDRLDKFLVSGPAVGLVNLGNTCFFNSAVQLLLACPQLNEATITNRGQAGTTSGRQADVGGATQFTPTPALLGRGPLGFALQQAFLNVNGPHSRGGPGSSHAPAHHQPTHHNAHGPKGAYNPHALLAAVCRVAPQFKGRQQHDSHELMRLLLDGLQEEEKRAAEMSRRRPSKDVATSPPPSPSPSPALPSPSASPSPPSTAPTSATTAATAAAASAEDSVIARLFGGELFSCIRCGTCSHTSFSQESFYDLSLPIPEDVPPMDERELKALAAGAATAQNESRGADSAAAGKGSGKGKAGKKLSKRWLREMEKKAKKAQEAAAKAAAAEERKGCNALEKDKAKGGKGKGKGKGREQQQEAEEELDPEKAAEAEAHAAEAARISPQQQGGAKHAGGNAANKKGASGQSVGSDDEAKAAGTTAAAGPKALSQKQLRKLQKEQRTAQIAASRQAKKADQRRQVDAEPEEEEEEEEPAINGHRNGGEQQPEPLIAMTRSASGPEGSAAGAEESTAAAAAVETDVDAAEVAAASPLAAADSPNPSEGRGVHTTDAHSAETAPSPNQPTPPAGTSETQLQQQQQQQPQCTSSEQPPREEHLPPQPSPPQEESVPLQPPRPRILDVGACLAAFFASGTVSWECPRERAEAADAAAAAAGCGAAPGSVAPSASGSLAATPLTPSLRKQVSWSPCAPEVFLVPGSAEQRGTNLEEAMRGNAPFFRPAKAHGASFIVQAQLDPFETETMHVQLLPLAGSTRAAALLAAAASSYATAATATAAAAAATSPIPATPMSPVLSTILSSSPRSSHRGAPALQPPSPRQKHQQPKPRRNAAGAAPAGDVLALGPGPFSERGLALACLDAGLAWRCGDSPLEQSRRVQAAAQVVMDCVADLMAAPGGLQHLLDMMAGGLELAEAAGRQQQQQSLTSRTRRSNGGSSGSSSSSSGGGRVRFMLRGRYRGSARCTTDSSATAVGEGGVQRGGGGSTGHDGNNGAEDVATAGAAAPSISAAVAVLTTVDDGGGGSGSGAAVRWQRGGGSGPEGGIWEYPTALRRPAEHPAFAHVAALRACSGVLTPQGGASSSSASASSSSSSSSTSSPDMSPANSDIETDGGRAGAPDLRLQPTLQLPPSVRSDLGPLAAAAAAAAAAAEADGTNAGKEGDDVALSSDPTAADGAAAAAAASSVTGSFPRKEEESENGDEETASSQAAALQHMHGVNLDPSLQQQHHHHHHHHHHHRHHHPHHHHAPYDGGAAVEAPPAAETATVVAAAAATQDGPWTRLAATSADGDALFEMDDLGAPSPSAPVSASADFVRLQPNPPSTPYDKVTGSPTAGVLNLLSPPPLDRSPASANMSVSRTRAALTSGTAVRHAIDGADAMAAPVAAEAAGASIATAAAVAATSTAPGSTAAADVALEVDAAGTVDGRPSTSRKASRPGVVLRLEPPPDHESGSEGEYGAHGGKVGSADGELPEAPAESVRGARPVPGSGPGSATCSLPIAIPNGGSVPSPFCAPPPLSDGAGGSGAAESGDSGVAPPPLPLPSTFAAGGRRHSSGSGLRRSGGGGGGFQRAATKQYYLRRAPEVLVLHLKRFAVDLRGRLTKIDKHVAFGTTLDLGPFVAAAAAAAAAAGTGPKPSPSTPSPSRDPDCGLSGAAAAAPAAAVLPAADSVTPCDSHGHIAARKGSSSGISDHHSTDGGPGQWEANRTPSCNVAASQQEEARQRVGARQQEQLQLQPQRSALASAVAAQSVASQQSCLYDLQGVVEHSGEMRYGHYVAYVKRSNPAAGGAPQWYYVSDTQVRPVAEAQVLRAQAYVMLYVRRRAQVPAAAATAEPAAAQPQSSSAQEAE